MKTTNNGLTLSVTQLLNTKNLYAAILFMTIIVSSAFTVATASKWNVKEDAYTVKFTSKKFEGIFKGLKADIQFDESNPSGSKISASIDANSVNSGNGLRNKHSRQGLGADKFPTISFESVSITKKGNGFEALGKLTIKDVTKDIVLPFTFTKAGSEGVFAGSFNVKPKEYNVTKAGTPEEISIQLNIPVK